MSITSKLTAAVQLAAEALYGTRPDEALVQLQKCKREFNGHLTLVVFPLLRLSGQKPEATAQQIAQWLEANEPVVAATEIVKGFLNITVAPAAWLELFKEISTAPNYGHHAPAPNSPLVMIEYSSPNTNKPLHLGHVRNNLLGFSLAEVLKANGYRVVKTNIVNDRGIHICKSMLAWSRWGNGATPVSQNKKGDHLVGDYYVLFDKHYKEEIEALTRAGKTKEQAEQESTLMSQARELLRKWEEGDPATLKLWHMMNEWVYTGFAETYQRLGVDFDHVYYESQTYLSGKKEVERGLEEGVLVREDDGSVWIDLTDAGLDKKILLRSDGTSVYITQDIGTAKLRFDDYPIDKMVYVVGNEQNYHFQVLAHVLDKLGFSFGKDLVHFSYGMVELPHGKMKSREGTVVDADDLMDDMLSTAKQIAREQGKALDMPQNEADEVARKVGLGALKYYILKVDPKRNMTFNPQESIDFQGNTGSFIQYTYARIRSLIRKAEDAGYRTEFCDTPSLVPSPKEQELIARLADYAEAVSEAGKSYSPAVIATYAYELVKEYNQFYHDTPVLKETDEALRTFRLALSAVVASTIERAMGLLGIEMPERM